MRLRYAVELTGAATQRSLIISVRNVISLEDYKAVTRAVASIQTLERVRPLSVDGDTLVLEVFGINEPETLMRLMHLMRLIRLLGWMRSILSKPASAKKAPCHGITGLGSKQCGHRTG